MRTRNVSLRNGLRNHSCPEKNSVWFKPAVWVLILTPSFWCFCCNIGFGFDELLTVVREGCVLMS